MMYVLSHPTDLTNIHRDNSSCDTTTTVSTLTHNKSIDTTNNSRDMITTDSHKGESFVQIDTTKIDRGNSSRDKTTIIVTLTSNKSIDMTNNSRETTTTTTTTDSTHPTNKLNDKIITTTTTTVPITTTTTTTTNPNYDTKSKAQRPAMNENLITTLSLDPRLLVNTVLTKQLFTNIIREYASIEPFNPTTKFILSNSLRPQIQYRTNQSRWFYPINGNNLTSINFNNDSLVTSYNRDLYLNFMIIEKIFKRKTYNLKFGINQISNNSQSGKSIVLPPIKTVVVSAQ